MNYELALELKNAGFPYDWEQLENLGVMPRSASIQTTPTLSELIEACGEKFVRLEKVAAYFQAYSNIWIYGDRDTKGYIAASGSTPEYAVAYLWLALNKKV